MLQKTDNPLQASILATLAYYDVFDYPLTVEELWRWLYVVDLKDEMLIQRATPADIEDALHDPALLARVDRAGAYVTLKGRSTIIATRMERHVGNQRKWRRARTVAGLLRFVPFVKFVGVVNTLAIDNARPESDIDFFIIVKAQRLWLTRLLVTGVVHALGVRRHGRQITDRVCLSFYLSDGQLDLSELALRDGDPYLTFWVTQVVPMFDRHNTWHRFVRSNLEVARRIPHGFYGVPMPYHADAFHAKSLRSTMEILLQTGLGQALERLVRRFQLTRMDQRSHSRRLQPTTDVVVNDRMLKFHEADRRLQYRQAFQQRLAGG